MGLMKLLNAFHAWSNSLISSRFPTISLYYYTKPRSFFYRRKHPVHKLLQGKNEITSEKKSVLFFTVHKSATSFMSVYLGELAKESGLKHIDYNGYFFAQGQASLEKQNSSALITKVFHKQGYLYGPLRYFLDIPEVDEYPVVLFLRDPRDVLTSQYFSLKNTHPLNTTKMIEKRKIAQSTSIDEHVRLQADRFLNTYTTYLDKLVGKPNVLLLRYEDMIVDFPAFLEKINHHFDLKLNETQKQRLDRTRSFQMTKEDISSHKRKVVAGDHKEKLQPKTIQWLNEKFDSVLKKLNY